MIDGPRGLRPDELDDLMELIHKVYNPRMRSSFPTLFCEENSENLRVIKADGKFVSHIGLVIRDMIIKGCRISVGNVGSVCTHEEYRKRGYAWAIFEDAMRKFRNEGVDLFLVSGYRSLYHLHGCTHVGKVAKYKLTSELHIPEISAQARLFSSQDLSAWSRIYQNEAVRFQRPYDDFQKLTERLVMFGGRKLYSVWESNEIIAYAVLDKNREGDINVVEYAGSRQALLGCTKTWYKDLESSNMFLSVPEYDKEFSVMLDTIGAKAKYASTGGTITILDFPRLCERMRPLFEEIVGRKVARSLNFSEKDGAYYISLDDNQVVINDSHDIARLIFGNPPDRNEHTEIKAPGKLGEVLESIFPIPRPEYGLSYI